MWLKIRKIGKPVWQFYSNPLSDVGKGQTGLKLSLEQEYNACRKEAPNKYTALPGI